MKHTIGAKHATKDAREVVLSFIDALNHENFDTAATFLDTKMKFEGVMGSRDGADAYIKDMEKMKFKYGVQKTFAEGDEVCLFYDITMSGTKIFSCGWYTVKEGKITKFKVIFDPRPLLEKSNKN